MKILDQVISKKMLDEEVILDLKSGTYFGLNSTGTYIFDLIKEGKSESDIVESVSKHFGISEAVAKTDVREFLSELKKEALLCGDL